MNLNFEFYTEDGKPIFMSQGDTRKPLNLKDAAVNALLYPPTDVQLTVKEKRSRYEVAMQLLNFSANVALMPEQKELVKLAIGQRFIPIVVGQACDILDGKEPPKFH